MCPISKTHVVVQRLARLSFKGSIHKTTTKQQSKFWNFLVIVVDLLEKMTFFGWKFSTTKFFTPIPRKKSTNPKFPPVFNNLTHSTPANSDPNFSAPQKKNKTPDFCFAPPKKKASRNWNNKTFRKPEKKKKVVQRCRNSTRSGFHKLRSQTSDLLQLGDFGVQVRVLLLHLLHLAGFTESGNVVCLHFGRKQNEEKQKRGKKKGGGWMIVFFWLGVVWVCIPSRELTWTNISFSQPALFWVDDFRNFRFGWVLCFLLEGRSNKKRGWK